MFPRSLAAALTLLLAVSASSAELKSIPPPGVAVPEPERAALTSGVTALGREIEALRVLLKDRPAGLALLPDVMIWHKAVDWALRYDEFFDPKQFAVAKKQLALGMQRAQELRAGKPSWEMATGLVVRGYLSKIDGSVQPYGLVIPDDWKPGEATPRRLDFWCHGRNEKLSELAFLDERMRSRGEFAPPGTIVLHLYGRYCCANKFAGERDLFEALENARLHYRIDPARMSVRGFSMGGASTWHLGTHFAGMWAAVAPGAGFAETAEYNHVFAAGKTPPPWWEQVLYRWYDATGYVANLANTTTVAYSGEIDGQKQAADIMLRFAEKEGLTFPHIIGPQTAHKYHPDAKPKIEQIVTAAAKGREMQFLKGHWTTYTLIYPALGYPPLGWPGTPRITSMEKEWERADIDWDNTDSKAVKVTTRNIQSFAWTPTAQVVTIDGQPVELAGLTLDSVGYLFSKAAGKWNSSAVIPFKGKEPAAKKHGSCGPIDHAFMTNFLFVRPTGKPLNDKVGAWTKAEMEHATGFWRKVFRGEVPIKADTALNASDLANSNLILWGDPSSNAVLAKIVGKLPLKWDGRTLECGGVKYDAAHHAPILIFPNPLNPARYVVLNSGVTFREAALLTNSQQTPKLPDWAVINLDTPPDPQWPGLVIDAGFFDESWQWPKK